MTGWAGDRIVCGRNEQKVEETKKQQQQLNKIPSLWKAHAVAVVVGCELESVGQ